MSYAGNKMLLSSREAREIRGALGVLTYQLGQLTGMIGQLHERVTKLEGPTAIKIAQPSDVPPLVMP